MANKENTESKSKAKKQRKLNPQIVAAAWLVFAVHQGFIGWVLLTNFSNYFVVAAAVLSLAMAGLTVLVHFFKGNK